MFIKKIPAQKQYQQQGLSLLELLITLSILSILAGLSLPSLSNILAKSKTNTAQADLRKAIASTRALAITEGQIATLCPNENCSGDWHDGYILFTDSNNNAIVDNNEQVVNRFGVQNQININWAGSGKVNYLKFSPTGIARQFGRFHICDLNDNPRNHRAMTINRQGRVRLYKDNNGDGIVEDINGSKPNC